MEVGTIVMLASLGLNFVLAVMGVLMKGRLTLALGKYAVVVKLMNAVEVAMADREVSEEEIKGIITIVNELTTE
jgi:hypothetical protein